MKWLFWSSLLVGMYPYVIYPLVVAVLGRMLNRVYRADDSYLPKVTVVISAYNEVAHIAKTIQNKLDQAYPPDRLDVIVVSDGSTDGTDEVIDGMIAKYGRLRLIRQDPRRGKTSAVNLAVAASESEIVVFSDANSIYASDAVRALVAPFADESVGYVTGKMVYVDQQGSMVGDGCSAYMRYENSLRRAETLLGSVVGVDGGIDAVRRRLFRPMRADQLPDFVLPLDVVEQGFRVVYAETALLKEDTLTRVDAEFRMRVRVALRAYWALLDKWTLMFPTRTGLFSWQLLSHKTMRYLSFLPLGLAFFLCWILAWGSPLYAAIAVVLSIAIAVALLAIRLPDSVGASRVAGLCSYFLLLNWASAVAFGRLLRGQKIVTWQPRVGD